MSKTFSGRLLGAFKVRNRRLRSGSTAGRAAFVVDAIAVNPQKRMSQRGAYLVPGDFGRDGGGGLANDPLHATQCDLAMARPG